MSKVRDQRLLFGGRQLVPLRITELEGLGTSETWSQHWFLSPQLFHELKTGNSYRSEHRRLEHRPAARASLPVIRSGFSKSARQINGTYRHTTRTLFQRKISVSSFNNDAALLPIIGSCIPCQNISARPWDSSSPRHYRPERYTDDRQRLITGAIEKHHFSRSSVTGKDTIIAIGDRIQTVKYDICTQLHLLRSPLKLQNESIATASFSTTRQNCNRRLSEHTIWHQQFVGLPREKPIL